jgi:glyoxylase-like metal-dependent hydrolase (beta-lactamase superfamily II)
MNPAGTGQISDTGIYAVKNRISSVFFIKTDSGYIMIDAGADMQRLEGSLKEISIDANDVNWIFLTHSDGDHVAALPLFPNADIYMGKDELPLINGTAKRSPFGGNTMPEGIDINKIIAVSDSQEILLGGMNVKCIKAPGHTPGSMAYLVDGKYLFSGDAFKMGKKAPGVHPFTMDAKLAKRTMENLKETINKSIVLTSHYGYFN